MTAIYNLLYQNLIISSTPQQIGALSRTIVYAKIQSVNCTLEFINFTRLGVIASARKIERRSVALVRSFCIRRLTNAKRGRSVRLDDGAWPSGKAPGFGPGIREFESLRPSQCFHD
jgi:hypothetical protein